MRGNKAEAGRKYRCQNRKDSSSEKEPKPNNERDTLNQSFLPESRDELKLIQNCAYIWIIQGNELSLNSHRDQDPSTHALRI